MKVYLVNAIAPYENCGCIGVFSSEEKANDFIDSYERIGENKDYFEFYQVAELQVDHMNFEE